MRQLEQQHSTRAAHAAGGENNSSRYSMGMAATAVIISSATTASSRGGEGQQQGGGGQQQQHDQQHPHHHNTRNPVALVVTDAKSRASNTSKHVSLQLHSETSGCGFTMLQFIPQSNRPTSYYIPAEQLQLQRVPPQHHTFILNRPP